MSLRQMSNGLLVVGVLMLGIFAVLALAGVTSDPLLPAAAAFLIGCTAVIDRVSSHELK